MCYKGIELLSISFSLRSLSKKTSNCRHFVIMIVKIVLVCSLLNVAFINMNLICNQLSTLLFMFLSFLSPSVLQYLTEPLHQIAHQVLGLQPATCLNSNSRCSSSSSSIHNNLCPSTNKLLPSRPQFNNQ